MKKIILFVLFSALLMAFENSKIENLMGKSDFQTYNKLLDRIFVKKHLDITQILSKLENNGLLNLFFKQAKLIHTKVIFLDSNYMFDTKILKDTLTTLGYYYFYPSQITKTQNRYTLNIEFKSEHYIDPISFIKEMKSRGCEVVDVYKESGEFNYLYKCQHPVIKNAFSLASKTKRYLDTRGVYWFKTKQFSFVLIKTRKIDYWHPSIWFYDRDLNLLNEVKIDKKTVSLYLKIPDNCYYLKVTDMYDAENFKRGIFIKGTN